MGRAILDYVRHHGVDEKLYVLSPMFDDDEMPLSTLFRTLDAMPMIERKALTMCEGSTLDVGAASGCHSLVLQERGIDVTAIDISPLSVEAMKERGVRNVYEQDFFSLGSQGVPSSLSKQYNTILMLMNGIGIVGTLERMPYFFKILDDILAPGGQVLCDSSDISYVFEDEEGFIEYPDDTEYYGELTFQMKYKDITSEPFSWLYIDADTLKTIAEQCGYKADIIAEGEHYDYLVRLTKK